MPKPNAEQIETLQRATNRILSLAALEIKDLGGEAALDGYLNHSLSHLLGVAIGMQGQERGMELMACGYLTAEAHIENPEC
jgi:hypothetical protein